MDVYGLKPEELGSFTQFDFYRTWVYAHPEEA